MAIQFKVLSLGCLVVNIIGMLIIIAVVFSMPSRGSYSKKICLPKKVGDSSGQLTCGPSKDRLALYMNELLQVKYKEKKSENKKDTVELKGNYAVHGRKPAARFTGKQGDMTSCDGRDGMCTVKCWNSGSDVFSNGGYQRYGVDYKNGRVIVPLAGTYHVYSFLDLEKSMEHKHHALHPSPIKHSIYKFTVDDNKDSEIVTFAQPVQNTTRPFNMYGSFISIISDLKAGDELMVKVSNSSLLQYKRFNTFGVMLV